MKNKDTQLLEEAYDNIVLNTVKPILQPLVNKLILKIKEKSPETFSQF